MATGDLVGQIGRIQPPQTLYAQEDWISGGSSPAEIVPVWDFENGDYLDIYFVLAGYNAAGGGLEIQLPWSASAATTGTIVWSVAVWRIEDDADDLDAGTTYSFTDSGSLSPPSAIGEVSYDSITISSPDGIQNNEWGILRVKRTSGTLSGDAELHADRILILQA